VIVAVVYLSISLRQSSHMHNDGAGTGSRQHEDAETGPSKTQKLCQHLAKLCGWSRTISVYELPGEPKEKSWCMSRQGDINIMGDARNSSNQLPRLRSTIAQ
jgi:hypothetical protein